MSPALKMKVLSSDTNIRRVRHPSRLNDALRHPKSGCISSKPSYTSSIDDEENIENDIHRHQMGTKLLQMLNPRLSSRVFQSSRKEAKQLLKSVKNLRSATHVLVRESCPSGNLVLAQNLKQTAMKKLEREFMRHCLQTPITLTLN
ncbi:hypothetical protein ACFX13_001268 [Malus domestica]